MNTTSIACGRIRPLPPGGPGWAYDYMLKDHLGNVRMVLTEEQKQDKYPVASLEDAKLGIEDDYYTIQTASIVAANTVTGLPAYTNDNGIGNNPADAAFSAASSQKLYKLNSNTNKTGLGITLKVMAGDKLDIFGKSYYFQNNTGGSGANSAIPVLDLLNGLVGSPGGTVGAAGHSGVTGTQLNGLPGTTGGISSLLSQQTSESNGNPTRPKAYINYIFLDDQFKYVSGGFSPVGSNSQLKDHFSELQNLTAQKSGFVYIYASNESPVNVFFDNLQVVHTRSPILEETQYYPFGLTMSGISSKAAGMVSNKRKFNAGSELQDKEFSDGSGLETYTTQFRMLDPQLGRWWQIDPKPNQTESPYAAMSNNPILKNDPLGDTAKFYNNAGGLIYTMNDGRKRITPTVISDKNLLQFVGMAVGGNSSVKTLQSFGLTYDTKAISKFYLDNKDKYTATSASGTSIGPNTTVSVNGQKVNNSSLKAEVHGNMVLKDNVLTPGSQPPVTSNSLTGSPQAPGGEPGFAGGIHLHPFAGKAELTIENGPAIKFITATGGSPSSADFDEHRRSLSNGETKPGVWSVIADSKNIILYQSGTQPIVIKRE